MLPSPARERARTRGRAPSRVRTSLAISPIGSATYVHSRGNPVAVLTVRELKDAANTGPERSRGLLGKPREGSFGVLDQGDALDEETVAELDQPGLAATKRNLAEQAGEVDAVPQSEQRPAIRSLGVDQAIEQERAQRRERGADQLTEPDPERLPRAQDLELGLQRFRVLRDREERATGGSESESAGFTSGVDQRALLALRELPAQLVAEVVKVARHPGV